MKIIYEDSDDRSGGSKKPGMKNIGSSFSRSDVPPAVTSVHSSARKMRKETQSITAEEAPKDERKAAFSGEDADFAPPAQKKEQPASAPQQPAAGQGAPEFKLTQEQIAFLLSQYLGSQAQSAASPSAGAQPAEPPKADETAQRAGTRIVFQSPDFDAPEELPKRREFSPVHIDYGYDIDGEDEEDEDEAPVQRKETFLLPGSGEASKSVPVVDEIDISTPRKSASARVLPVPDRNAQTHAPSVSAVPPRRPASAAPAQNSGSQARPSAVLAAKSPTVAESSLTVSHVEEKTAEDAGKKKKKKMSATDIIRIVVLAISFVAIIISAGKLINEYRLHKENQKLESDLADLTIEDEETTKKPKDKKNNKDQKTEQTETTLSAAQKWAQIKEEYPNTKFPEGLQLKYARLYATNNDFAGYLEAKGVGLSLPVVQTGDDETYLNKNFYGASTKYGCPFVSCVNNLETLDMNTVIYGHHMNDKSIFGALDHYKTLDGFKAAPVITFNTLYKNYKWKVIAAFITNAEEKDDNGYVFRYYFNTLSTQERFSAYLNELAQRSLYDTGVDVLPTDKLLTLSTCSHEFEDARFVVVARLVRPGEKAEVDMSKAALNENPRYPQAYYTAKKLTNPYYNAARWEVD